MAGVREAVRCVVDCATGEVIWEGYVFKDALEVKRRHGNARIEHALRDPVGGRRGIEPRPGL